MTSIRHLDDQKRGYPTTVGALAPIVARHGMRGVLDLGVNEWVALVRETIACLEAANRAGATRLAERYSAEIAVLKGIESLTPGQRALLKFKVRR